MKLTSIIFVLTPLLGLTQQSETDILKHREQHKLDLLDTANHMLNTEEIKAFQGLDYYEFDATYQVNVKFSKDKGQNLKCQLRQTELQFIDAMVMLTF